MPVNCPQLCFERWGEIPSDHPDAIPVPDRSQDHFKFLQRGFYLANDGGTAHEITVQSFEIGPSVRASSGTLARIREKGEGFAFVWLDGYPPLRIATKKWDLLGAMAECSQRRDGNFPFMPDYSVTVCVTYRDAGNRWYRSSAVMSYVPSQGGIKFGPTTHESSRSMRPAQSGPDLTAIGSSVARAPMPSPSDSFRDEVREQQFVELAGECGESDENRKAGMYAYSRGIEAGQNTDRPEPTDSTMTALALDQHDGIGNRYVDPSAPSPSQATQDGGESALPRIDKPASSSIAGNSAEADTELAETEVVS
jgi:hypothetical protein